jgi:hypothetical protein
LDGTAFLAVSASFGASSAAAFRIPVTLTSPPTVESCAGATVRPSRFVFRYSCYLHACPFRPQLNMYEA